jgi:NitT/TauT family transport system substrate-binding protein
MRSRVLAAVAAVVVVTLVAAGVGWAMRRTAAPARLENVVIAANTEYVGTCAVVAGRARGYFRDEGMTVEVLSYSSGKASLQAVFQGKADLATVADIPIMFAAMDGVPVRVLATFFRTEKDHGLVARRDHGISKGADLKGKRVGVTPATSGHFTLDVFLNWQRLQSEDVTLVPFKPEQMADALARGDVDAVATWEPFLQQTRDRLGENALSLSGENVYESIYNLVGMQSYVLTHPDTARRLLRALGKAGDWCHANPEAAQQLMPAIAKLGRTELLATWPSYEFGLDLDQGMLLGLEDRARWAMRNQLSAQRQMPNFLEYVYLDALVAVRPSAVSIIH